MHTSPPQHNQRHHAAVVLPFPWQSLCRSNSVFLLLLRKSPPLVRSSARLNDCSTFMSEAIQPWSGDKESKEEDKKTAQHHLLDAFDVSCCPKHHNTCNWTSFASTICLIIILISKLLKYQITPVHRLGPYTKLAFQDILDRKSTEVV